MTVTTFDYLQVAGFVAITIFSRNFKRVAASIECWPNSYTSEQSLLVEAK